MKFEYYSDGKLILQNSYIMQMNTPRPTNSLPHCKYLWVVFVLFLSYQASSASSVKKPAGPVRHTTYADLKAHTQPSRTYNEFWTYQFSLNQGIQLVLNFSRANLGIKDPVCGTDMGLIGFMGKNYALAREYPKKNFKFSDGKQQLNIHKKIWFGGKLPETHRVYLNTRKNNISYLIDLKFSDIEQGVTFGDGVFKLGAEKIGLYIHIPRAKVHGIIAINQDTVEVNGIGYMDHTFQSKMGTKLVSAGYRYQALGDEIHAAYCLVPKSSKGELFGIGVKGKPGALTAYQPARFETLEKSKRKNVTLATKLKVHYGNQQTVFQRGADAQQWSVLSELGRALRWGAKKLMGGEVIYFRGKGSLDGKPAFYNLFGVNN